ncbi:MAG: peptidoglycan DD-metalloendopeptidase family protein [Acidobacteria bacterium]|nr:peptidoglycan DD-metalloendopeptidase family protein [Acidobacteriota bacterium]
MKGKGYSFIILIAILLLLSSCAPSPKKGLPRKGIYHIVEPGQTLWRIAKAYGVDLEYLAEINGIDDPTLIYVGEKIFIPGARKRLYIPPYKPPSLSFFLSWPLFGEVTSLFGPRGNGFHTGIDIAAKPGTPIRAAADGVVIYAGQRFHGYGKMVMIEHPGGITTIYAHNKENLVRKGDRVRRGEIIALVGSSGNATGPHLHFEVRKGNTPINPILLLTKK